MYNYTKNIKYSMKKKDERILYENREKSRRYIIKKKIQLIKKYSNIYINLIKHKSRKEQEILILKYLLIRADIKNDIISFNNASLNF